MKKITKIYSTLIAIAIVVLSITAINAQSTDIDNPTPMTSTTIEGVGDGKGETIYYSFDASKGDVKVTVDAKTDYYSTPVQVTLLDENSKELLPIYVVAKGAGQREVRTRYFVRDQKVIVRISTRDDGEVKLLNFKVRIEGAVQFAAAPAQADLSKQQGIEQMQNNATATGQPSETPASGATGQPSETPASGATGQPSETTPATDSGAATGTGTGTKTPLKKKAKDAMKDALKKIIDN